MISTLEFTSPVIRDWVLAIVVVVTTIVIAVGFLSLILIAPSSRR